MSRIRSAAGGLRYTVSVDRNRPTADRSPVQVTVRYFQRIGTTVGDSLTG